MNEETKEIIALTIAALFGLTTAILTGVLITYIIYNIITK